MPYPENPHLQRAREERLACDHAAATVGRGYAAGGCGDPIPVDTTPPVSAGEGSSSAENSPGGGASALERERQGAVAAQRAGYEARVAAARAVGVPELSPLDGAAATADIFGADDVEVEAPAAVAPVPAPLAPPLAPASTKMKIQLVESIGNPSTKPAAERRDYFPTDDADAVADALRRDEELAAQLSVAAAEKRAKDRKGQDDFTAMLAQDRAFVKTRTKVKGRVKGKNKSKKARGKKVGKRGQAAKKESPMQQAATVPPTSSVMAPVSASAPAPPPVPVANAPEGGVAPAAPPPVPAVPDSAKDPSAATGTAATEEKGAARPAGPSTVMTHLLGTDAGELD